MGYMNAIDVDIQNLEEAYFDTALDAEVAVGRGEPDFSIEHRARLGSRLAEIGWISPTAAAVAAREIRVEQRLAESTNLARALTILTPPAAQAVEVKAA